MSMMRLQEKRGAHVPASKVVRRKFFKMSNPEPNKSNPRWRNTTLGCHSNGIDDLGGYLSDVYLGEYQGDRNLGIFGLDDLVMGASLAASGSSIFSKIFAGGPTPAQKKSMSLQRRHARAAGVMQGVANVLAAYPNAVENKVLGDLERMYTDASRDHRQALQNAPCEVVQAYIQAPFTSEKKKAARIEQDRKNDASASILPSALCGRDWWNAYLAGNFTGTFGPVEIGYDSMGTPREYSGGVPDISGCWQIGNTKVNITQGGNQFTLSPEGGGGYQGKFVGPNEIDVNGTRGTASATTLDFGGTTFSRCVVAVATPTAQASPQAPAVATPVQSGQTQIISSGPATPPSWFTPTESGQSTTNLQASISPNVGWAILAGLGLLLFLPGKSSPRKRRRPARGTTVIRRY